MPDRRFVLHPLWELFQKRVFPVGSGDGLFNPYADASDALDIHGAGAVRRKNLENYLRAFPETPPILVVGEAPGPRGCRFTGVPFTSERLFAESALPFKGRKTSAQVESLSEPSATIFWRVMAPHFPLFLVWNTLPFHPHRPDQPLSIRPPMAKEVRAHLGLVEEVLRIIEPERILGVGRVAQVALRQLNRTFISIRHPSHGGAAEFARNISHAFPKITVEEGSCIPS